MADEPAPAAAATTPEPDAETDATSPVLAPPAPPMTVRKTSAPPSRLEGGGFTIKDILDGWGTAELDPFLIWHELPRTEHGKGDMPGAPLHAHRGFMECPYAKELTGETPYNYMKGRVEAGGKTVEATMPQGNFELGKVGIGMQVSV